MCLFEPGTSIQSAELPSVAGVKLCNGATYRVIVKTQAVKFKVPFPTPGRWTIVTYQNGST